MNLARDAAAPSPCPARPSQCGQRGARLPSQGPFLRPALRDSCGCRPRFTPGPAPSSWGRAHRGVCPAAQDTLTPRAPAARLSRTKPARLPGHRLGFASGQLWQGAAGQDGLSRSRFSHAPFPRFETSKFPFSVRKEAGFVSDVNIGARERAEPGASGATAFGS